MLQGGFARVRCPDCKHEMFVAFSCKSAAADCTCPPCHQKRTLLTAIHVAEEVVAFIEPPQREVIEKILQHCGLWQASAPRAPPDVDGLVLELDAAYSASSIGSPNQDDQSRELTYVAIDTFLASF